MPKTNLCKPRVDPREAELKAIIVGGLIRCNISREGLAKKVKLPYSTLNQHIRNIRDMRVGELWDILDVLKPEESEKLKILQEVSK